MGLTVALSLDHTCGNSLLPPSSFHLNIMWKSFPSFPMSLFFREVNISAMTCPTNSCLSKGRLFPQVLYVEIGGVFLEKGH